jgi:exopolyphosphatase/guanosine-5'-triphosphate,3'-diphosphate pyrophosphatase
VRKAAIDVGSNSVLLVVADVIGSDISVVFESSAVTGLGEGARETGRLSDDAMRRTLAAVREAWTAANSRGAIAIRAAATMAARMASNAEVFLGMAHDQGTPVEILSADDEAALGFRAVALDPCFESVPRLLIVDVGGHSTELAAGNRPQGLDLDPVPDFKTSFPIGTLGLVGGLLRDECPDGLALLNASRHIDDWLRSTPLPELRGAVIALGATPTNLVAIREGLSGRQPEAVHGAILTYEEISGAVGWLSRMTLAERSRIVGMEPGREGTLHAGALILERVLFALGSDSCLASVRGWRHALLLLDP